MLRDASRSRTAEQCWLDTIKRDISCATNSALDADGCAHLGEPLRTLLNKARSRSFQFATLLRDRPILSTVPVEEWTVPRYRHLFDDLSEMEREIRRLGDDEEAAYQRLTTLIHQESKPASIDVAPRTKTVYISYKCGGDTDAGCEREAFVDRLDASLQSAGHHVRRDKRDIHYKDSIQKFMVELGRGNCIVVVLSDEYMRSEFCMYELVQTYLNHDFRERICPVLVSDFPSLTPREQNEYVKFWVKERDEAQQDVASIPGGVGENAYGTRIGRIRDIAHYVADILSHVFDMKCLNQAELEANNFQLLKQAITERIE